LPEDFNGATTPENSAQVGIEEFFNDPTLINLIDQALVGDQDTTSNSLWWRIQLYF
jgi:outer membrane protein, multidrug efflux system